VTDGKRHCLYTYNYCDDTIHKQAQTSPRHVLTVIRPSL